MDNRTFEFKLNISYSSLLDSYNLPTNIVVKSSCGTTLSLPLARLRPFLTHGGITGLFKATIDPKNRLLDIRKH
ncbi:DUF2835 family protein [Vibrio coralliirubri]|uniref:DUF2835 family protein n=1 Tax=Vibrio coralliirubri TaxID=1516159 RepID=UPI003B9832C3